MNNNINTNIVNKPKLRIVKPNESIIPFVDIPFCNFKKSKFDKDPNEKLVIMKSKLLKYSAYKLNASCMNIRKKRLLHALTIIENDPSKGGQLIKEYLQKFITRNQKNEEKRADKGLVNDKPYHEWEIAEAYVGKKNGAKIPRPRAKGRMFFITRHYSRLNLVFRRVDAVEASRTVLTGRADPTYAYFTRQYLFFTNASLREINSNSHITTSRGRMYRRVQFKRMITLLRERFNKRHGVLLSRVAVEENLKKYLITLDKTRVSYDRLLRYQSLTPSEKLKAIVDDKFREELDKKTSPAVDDFNVRQEIYNKKVKKI
jgi:ribosomal protein L22